MTNEEAYGEIVRDGNRVRDQILSCPATWADKKVPRLHRRGDYANLPAAFKSQTSKDVWEHRACAGTTSCQIRLGEKT